MGTKYYYKDVDIETYFENSDRVKKVELSNFKCNNLPLSFNIPYENQIVNLVGFPQFNIWAKKGSIPLTHNDKTLYVSDNPIKINLVGKKIADTSFSPSRYLFFKMSGGGGGGGSGAHYPLGGFHGGSGGSGAGFCVGLIDTDTALAAGYEEIVINLGSGGSGGEGNGSSADGHDGSNGGSSSLSVGAHTITCTGGKGGHKGGTGSKAVSGGSTEPQTSPVNFISYNAYSGAASGDNRESGGSTSYSFKINSSIYNSGWAGLEGSASGGVGSDVMGGEGGGGASLGKGGTMEFILHTGTFLGHGEAGGGGSGGSDVQGDSILSYTSYSGFSGGGGILNLLW